MEDSGLWQLFFATGLPQAWMAAHQEGTGRRQFPPLPAPGIPGLADRGETDQTPPDPPVQAI